MKNFLLSFLMLTMFMQSYSQNSETQSPQSDKTRIIKTDFFAPLTGNLTFGYEQMLMNSMTIEGSIGIIGAGFIQDNLHPAGIFIKAGPKFFFSPDYTFDGLHRANYLQGAYFNPEIVYSGFAFDYETYNSSNGTFGTARGSNNSFALMLNFGKQWVLAKIIAIDLYAGVGYGGSAVNAPDAYGYGNSSYNESEIVPYKYSHLQPDNQIPIAVQAGFKIGVLIK
ncbi:MAG: DUF3575 domain-containing protein [Chitinophagales bacterium]|nr:DUF3575 domain-containing protein [Chitinophagales bacterium]